MQRERHCNTPGAGWREARRRVTNLGSVGLRWTIQHVLEHVMFAMVKYAVEKATNTYPEEIQRAVWLMAVQENPMRRNTIRC